MIALRKRLSTLARRAAPVIAGLLLVAMVLRRVWRDELVWTAPTFYALPLPVHVLGWIFLTTVWWKVNRRLRWLCVAAAVCPAVLWWMNTKSLRGEAVAASGEGPRVFLWNIGHVRAVPPALHELITELAPDAVVLAEAENLGAAGMAELMKQHDGFRAVELEDGVSCLVRGTFSPPSSRQLGWRVSVNVVTATFARLPGEYRLCLTDIPPFPPVPRTDYLDAIRKEAGEGKRTIIAADFNTPLDSAGFDAWRREYRHGFADCESWHGPLETWCFGVPVLAIDHIWMSQDLAPRSARKESRFGQDHSWLFVECGTAAP